MNPNNDCKRGLTIRRMERAEVDLAIEWAAAEGWNPGLDDADCFYSSDPEGFFMAFLDGKPVGSVSAVRYGDKFGFIGLFIVRPEFRGGRLGIHLGKTALERLDGRNIGLDGVLKKVENYKTYGFHYAYKNIRFELHGGGTSAGNCEPLSDFGFAEISRYDAAIFGTARDVFLRSWLAQKNALALGVKASSRLAGYGVIRKCRVGYKIGPLFADELSIAEKLLDGLLLHAGNDPVYIDVPEPNKTALKLVKRCAAKEVFETARMYSRTPPALPIEKIFGITTFELG